MRHLALVVSVLVGVGGVLVFPATAAGAADGDGSGVSVMRYGGADRYETSLQVAETVAADAGGSLERVVVVSGRRWTDAVVAAPVAGALGAPVLMTPPDELRADALEFLGRVGVSKALVVGPEASGGGHGPGRGVDAEVLKALSEAGIATERVAGGDRYRTGVAAAERVTPGVMGELGRTAVIASGEEFADALVAGPFAARGVHPVLLSPPGELLSDVAGYLGDAGIDHVVLMGGTAALSRTVEQSVKDLGIEVTRVAGATRYDTSARAAKLVEDRYSTAAGQPCFATGIVGLARARVPFDSFSAAPLLGRLCAPLLLVDPDRIPDESFSYLIAARQSHDVVGLRIFGGDAAVSQAAVDTFLICNPSDTGDPPYSGTVWVTPDILGSSDPSSFGNVISKGRGIRDIFDRRVSAWITVDAYLFEVLFGDRVVEFQINPEFGSEEAAREQIDTFAPAIGRLPSVLISELREVEVNAGAGLFGGNSWNRSLLIHADDPATKDALSRGFLEEVFLHEGAHAALDHLGAVAEWRVAQRADDAFISEYARDFPSREDIAESFLPYYAVRQRPERLTAMQRCIMSTATPNRLAFFDDQQFDLSTKPSP